MSNEHEEDARGQAAAPKTAVIGASGFLGRRFLAAYRVWHPGAAGVTRAGAAALDLAAPAGAGPLAERLAAQGHTHVLIAAAITGIARCEREPESTRAVNVEGTLRLAHHVARAGMVPVWLSSDYVFDGETGNYADDAPRRPLNHYGMQKAEVEQRLVEASEAGDRVLVARLSKVFSLQPGDGTLLDEMAASLAAGRAVRAAHDQTFSPTLVDDVVRVVLDLQRRGATGIVNVCAPEAWSRLDLARAVARAMRLPAERVEAIALADLGEPFRRPRRTHLSGARLAQLVPGAAARFTPVATCVETVARAHAVPAAARTGAVPA